MVFYTLLIFFDFVVLSEVKRCVCRLLHNLYMNLSHFLVGKVLF